MDVLNLAKSLIEKSRNILILPSADLEGDNLGSALALFFTLRKLGKNANVLIDNIPEKFQFLTESQLNSPQDFVITVDTSKKEVSEMRYEKNEKDLKIYLTLGNGGISEKDVSLAPYSSVIKEFPIEQGEKDVLWQNPDLLITLGAKSFEELGRFFDQNPKLFYETPILNIDNRPSNEGFGEVNLVELTSSSLAEISTNLIKLIEEGSGDLLNRNIATCLLTGIIYASQNFRNSKTRPKTLETASYLIERGADHQKIIQHLYKQKGVSQIKLLGRILEKLNFNEKKELHFASLTKQDFQDCQASSRDLSFVIEELKFNFRYLPNLLILWESHASSSLVKGIFYSSKPESIKRILENFEGVSRGEGVLFFIREGNLNSAQEKILNIL